MKTGPSSAYGSVLLGPAEQGTRRLRVRVQLLLTVLLVGTNLIGAGIVFVLSTLVIPSPTPNDDTVLALAIGVPVYVGRRDRRRRRLGHGGRAARAALGRSRTETPTDEERLSALGVPWFLTKIQAALWFGATVLFTRARRARCSPSARSRPRLTVGIASLVVCGIAYLFSEFALRPDRRTGTVRRGADQGPRPRRTPPDAALLGARHRRTRGRPGRGRDPGAHRCGDISLTKLAVVVLVLGGVVLCFGLLVTWLNARAVVAPILVGAQRDGAGRGG